MKKSFLVTIACVMCVSFSMLSGCGTVNGTGKAISDIGNGAGSDINSAGRAVQRAS